MSSPARALFLIILGLAACGGGSAKTPDASVPDASVCPSSQTDCNGTCATLSADPINCGACGNACAAGDVCSNGTCQLSCQAGLSACNGTCTNLMTDNANCGGCGSACAVGDVCSNGACQLSCQASLTDCNGTCANLMSDNANCGACGSACDPGSVCSNGTCQLSCQASLTDCNDTCSNLLSDDANCGACGSACDPGNVCSSGTCQLSCQAGLNDCSGTCANLMSDNANCGACGTVCGPAQTCSMGACVSSCEAPLSVCNGVCADLDEDPANCGTCGNACGAGQTCTNGTCQDGGGTTYLPNGPQQNVPVASLTGWSLCYSDTYDQNMQAQVSTIQASCTGSRILMACRQHNSTTITLLAQGLRTDVFTDTGAANNSGHSDGKVLWYFDPNYSWGFATPGDTLSLGQCDTGNDGPAAGTDRLCWHTINASGGYRCGTTINLNTDATWDRLIYQAN
jgi:hypothetical protein